MKPGIMRSNVCPFGTCVTENLFLYILWTATPFSLQSHNLNACWHARNLYNNVLCSKSVQEMMFKAGKMLSTIDVYSALYCLNVVFAHKRSYTKSAHFCFLYLFKFCQLFLKCLVCYRCKIKVAVNCNSWK